MVSVVSLSKKFRPLEAKLRRAGEAALARLKYKRANVDVYLVSDPAMKKLNREFRRKNKATNVLSFREPEKFPHPEGKGQYLGEIYLAPEYVRKSGENLERLFHHGLLHLLGYTHKKRSDRIKMEKAEKSLETWLIS
ncbi:MAG: putative rRNA maturation factor [Candidatus Jorgensenbacteria bacterium GW2011_GWA1_48_13]|uniref:Endoribonuclease YbeY n=1 Tax=Candidatus Jorgensenbacteria bacterium GW2011_GWB1_50_10 TaxID=1618665 RepID=A0A0G1W7S3_9BACT|nr:MAG: putative rRNA maturation factor [Candidatus Jorgensenbacteria bacterium GW2011_GWA1_48_13]KKW14821.1 MAG: putative rRNA maturation factor [Candidatus Jorgensenbacteria bacterium GW2011_GWB1_50_10]